MYIMSSTFPSTFDSSFAKFSLSNFSLQFSNFSSTCISSAEKNTFWWKCVFKRSSILFRNCSTWGRVLIIDWVPRFAFLLGGRPRGRPETLPGLGRGPRWGSKERLAKFVHPSFFLPWEGRKIGKLTSVRSFFMIIFFFVWRETPERCRAVQLHKTICRCNDILIQWRRVSFYHPSILFATISLSKRPYCLTSKNFCTITMPDEKSPPKSDPAKPNPPKQLPEDPKGKTGPPPPKPLPKGKEPKPMPGVS